MATPSRKADILVRIARYEDVGPKVEYTFIPNTRRGKKALVDITGEKDIGSEQVRGQLRIESTLGKLLTRGCYIALVEDQEAF